MDVGMLPDLPVSSNWNLCICSHPTVHLENGLGRGSGVEREGWGLPSVIGHVRVVWSKGNFVGAGGFPKCFCKEDEGRQPGSGYPLRGGEEILSGRSTQRTSKE